MVGSVRRRPSIVRTVSGWQRTLSLSHSPARLSALLERDSYYRGIHHISQRKSHFSPLARGVALSLHSTFDNLANSPARWVRLHICPPFILHGQIHNVSRPFLSSRTRVGSLTTPTFSTRPWSSKVSACHLPMLRSWTARSPSSWEPTTATCQVATGDALGTPLKLPRVASWRYPSSLSACRPGGDTYVAFSASVPCCLFVVSCWDTLSLYASAG